MSTTKPLTIPGDMTIYEAEELKAIFDEAEKSVGDVLINLSNVAEIDSSGLQLMVSLKKTLNEEKREVNFEAHSEAVINLFDLFDIANYFGDPIVIDNKGE